MRIPTERYVSQFPKAICTGVEEEIQKALSTRAGARADIQPVFIITVDDPQKVGDPIRSFTMYTVHTRVRRILSSFPIAELMADTRRQHLQYIKNLPSLSSVDIQTSFGYMMPFK